MEICYHYRAVAPWCKISPLCEAVASIEANQLGLLNITEWHHLQTDVAYAFHQREVTQLLHGFVTTTALRLDAF